MSQTSETWSPRDEKNPFRIWSMNTNEEWKQISRWYEFSIRVLVVLHGKKEWFEEARCKTWHDAKKIMILLGEANTKDHIKGYVVMKCTLHGKEGREKPVLWYPSEEKVRAAIG